MSDLIDGVVVEYFDIDHEIEKMKADDSAIVFVDEDPKDLEAEMDDDSSEEAADWDDMLREQEDQLFERMEGY